MVDWMDQPGSSQPARLPQARYMQRGIDWLHVCLKSLYPGITFDYLLMRAVPSANFYLSLLPAAAPRQPDPAETADSPVARSLAHQLEQATKLAVPASHKPGSASISRQQLPVCLQGVVRGTIIST